MDLKQLIDDADRWRLALAAQIVRDHPQIGDGDLNRAVRRSLQDALFLKICSGRRLFGGPELLREIDEPEESTRGPAPLETPVPPFSASLRDLPDDLLGHLHEHTLARPVQRNGDRTTTASGRTARRGQGVYYTPTFVVDYIVRHTLGPLVDKAASRSRTGHALAIAGGRPWSGDFSHEAAGHPPTIVDPACGAGAFLLGAFEYLAHRCDSATARTALVRRHLFGVDRDPDAVRCARLSLALKMLGLHSEPASAPALVAQTLQRNIRCGDALLETDLAGGTGRASVARQSPTAWLDWHRAFPFIFDRQPSGFDAVVGNPPYVNIRRVTQQLGETAKRSFRARFRCARGSYDLYVLFLERAFDLLRGGGRCGMIVPNKLATLGYAEACRRLLLTDTTIEQIVDVADMAIFRGAGVYPCILGWRKEPPGRQHRIRVVEPRPEHATLTGPLPSRSVKQTSLSASRGFTLAGDLQVESRVPTAALSDLAELHSGTTGFSAAEIAAALIDSDSPQEDHFEFIVSGNIDRYRVTGGQVRFMKRTFRRPLLPVNAPCLSYRKRALFAGPKIVVAGLTRRLEAAFDPGGTALGVQVYAIRQPQVDPMYLLAVLNSRLLSQLFRQRFAAKRLAGGYLAINKAQLGQLPIRQLDLSRADERRVHDQLVHFAQRLTRLHQFRQAADPRMEAARLAEIDRIDAQIDEAVEGLYQVYATELAA